MASISAKFQHEQPDLEVVPPETGLYPLPAPTPTITATRESLPKEQTGSARFGGDQQTLSQAESQSAKNSKTKVLGLSVPVFWALIVTLFIVLAAGIGGGVGGGLSAQRKSASTDASRFITFTTIFLFSLCLGELTIDSLAAIIAIPAAAKAPRHPPRHPLPHHRLHHRRPIP